MACDFYKEFRETNDFETNRVWKWFHGKSKRKATAMQDLPALTAELIELETKIGSRLDQWKFMEARGATDESYRLKLRLESIEQLVLVYLNGRAFVHDGIVFVPTRDQDGDLIVEHYPTFEIPRRPS